MDRVSVKCESLGSKKGGSGEGREGERKRQAPRIEKLHIMGYNTPPSLDLLRELKAEMN